MKVQCNREKLAHAFGVVSAVVPTRSTKSILKNVKMEVEGETTTLMATDMEIGIRYEVASVQVETPGAAVLPVSNFGPIIRESSDELLSLDADASGISVRGERSQFKLPAEDPYTFPSVASFDRSDCVAVPPRLLKEIIHRTLFATESESSRYALGGVLFEFDDDQLTGVATDGRRLAKMEGPVTRSDAFQVSDGTTIVPAKALQLLQRILEEVDTEVQLAFADNAVLVHTERATIHAQLLQGRFPSWRDVFPKRASCQKLEMVVGPLLAAVRQAAIATSDDSRGIDFQFSEGTLVLSGSAADVGQSRVELPIAYDGPEMTIKLDPRFLIDFLRVLELDKTFMLEFESAKSAVTCVTSDGYSYVIMPLARE